MIAAYDRKRIAEFCCESLTYIFDCDVFRNRLILSRLAVSQRLVVIIDVVDRAVRIAREAADVVGVYGDAADAVRIRYARAVRIKADEASDVVGRRSLDVCVAGVYRAVVETYKAADREISGTLRSDGIALRVVVAVIGTRIAAGNRTPVVPDETARIIWFGKGYRAFTDDVAAVTAGYYRAVVCTDKTARIGLRNRNDAVVFRRFRLRGDVSSRIGERDGSVLRVDACNAARKRRRDVRIGLGRSNRAVVDACNAARRRVFRVDAADCNAIVYRAVVDARDNTRGLCGIALHVDVYELESRHRRSALHLAEKADVVAVPDDGHARNDINAAIVSAAERIDAKPLVTFKIYIRKLFVLRVGLLCDISKLRRSVYHIFAVESVLAGNDVAQIFFFRLHGASRDHAVAASRRGYLRRIALAVIGEIERRFGLPVRRHKQTVDGESIDVVFAVLRHGEFFHIALVFEIERHSLRGKERFSVRIVRGKNKSECGHTDHLTVGNAPYRVHAAVIPFVEYETALVELRELVYDEIVVCVRHLAVLVDLAVSDRLDMNGILTGSLNIEVGQKYADARARGRVYRGAVNLVGIVFVSRFEII